jgi:hypothetical protein
MRVKNINGTSDNTCRCGSWLKHWKRFGGAVPYSYCAESSCRGSQEVGAHIQIEGSADGSWYIVPLCSSHNAKTGGSFGLMDGTTLVSANVAQTCGKW